MFSHVTLKKGYEHHYEHLGPAIVKDDDSPTGERINFGGDEASGLMPLANFNGPRERRHRCFCGEAIVFVETEDKCPTDA